MRFRHEMPFGAQLTADGCVRFRLWAPSAQRVELQLESAAYQATLPMSSIGAGWHEIISPLAGTASRYTFLIDGRQRVPDPASRANPDVHGASIVVDPLDFEWRNHAWRGVPLHRAVFYELHVGTFTPEGTFAALEAKLDHLVELGVTVIELMPIAAFPGNRGWGYDGVLPFAPQSNYGTPDELKRLIDAAHGRGLAVILDVVYNHFGPEGNWLHAYVPEFFTDRHATPWGAAINLDGERSDVVRSFFIENALYWLEEYRFDGLRLDAVHAMHDAGPRHFTAELVERVRAGPGRERHVLVVLENHHNEARRLGPAGSADRADAQWNDDLHHCLHVLLTGERDGYYADYAARPLELLCRALAEGFSFQGEASAYAGGRLRGEPSAGLPPTAFVSFLQNHDQIGNRARGERLRALAVNDQALYAAAVIVMLAPAPPLLFMGEEWAADEPFPYFCDFEPDLARKVREGRRLEFARFAPFGSGEALPDPTAVETFRSAQLDWRQVTAGQHALWFKRYRRLLAVRAREIAPQLPALRCGRCVSGPAGGAFVIEWSIGEKAVLRVIANLSAQPAPLCGRAAGRVLFATHPDLRGTLRRNSLDAWSVIWLRERAAAIGPGRA